MISSFQGLRFFNALLIFCHHKNSLGNPYLTAFGPCAVSFFFFLSGFSMSLGYYEKSLSPDFDYAGFMRKRIVRLYPLHLLCLFLYLGMNGRSVIRGGVQIFSIACNFFLVQSWIPKQGVYFSGNAVSWCLSDLMFFYAVFPLVVRLLRYRARAVAFTVLYGLFYLLCLIFCPARYAHAVMYINPLCRFFDFYLGILLYRIYVRCREKMPQGHPIALLSQVGALLVSFAAMYFYERVDERLRYASLFFLPSALMVLSFSLFDGYGLARLLNNRMAVYLGSISFTFYMLHNLGISFINAVTAKLGLDVNFVAKGIIQFCFVLAGSIVVYHFFELPIARKCNKKISGRRNGG